MKKYKAQAVGCVVKYNNGALLHIMGVVDGTLLGSTDGNNSGVVFDLLERDSNNDVESLGSAVAYEVGYTDGSLL